MPLVREMTMMPTARADALMTAMAASLFQRGLVASRSRKNAATLVLGAVLHAGLTYYYANPYFW